MLEQNYTNPEGIGRFSFSESGSYRAPYKNEGLYVILTLMAAMFLEAAVIVFALTFMHEFILSLDEKAAMFAAIVSAAIIALGSIIIIAVSGTIIARTFGGMDCQYSALEDKFILTIGGDTHVINYNEVQSVIFTPRYFLGKVKGYDVDITVANKVEHYGVTFRGQYQSEKTTPFYIIKDRVEIIERRRNDERVLYAQQKIGADKPVSQNEIERARLRKNASNDIFPPNTQNYREKMPSVEKAAPTMDSVAPRSVSKPKMAGVSAENERRKTSEDSEQMPEMKAVSRPKAPVVQEKSAAPENPGMSEIAPINKRPSSEIFASNAEKPDSNDSENSDDPESSENKADKEQ